MIYLQVELKKLKRRHTAAAFLLTLAFLAAYTFWCLTDVNPGQLNDVTAMVEMNLLIINTVFSPVLMAFLASRLADMELAGNTLKWLCILQPPASIYWGKAAVGLMAAWLFAGVQSVLFFAACAPFPGLNPGCFLQLFVTLAAVCSSLFALQLNLSLRSSSQLAPLFLAIGAAFAGLFSWFLPVFPLRYLIPWGYFSVLCNLSMTYTESTRYTLYEWKNYPLFWLGVILLFSVITFRRGCRRFQASAGQI